MFFAANESSVTTTGNNTGNTFPVGERCFSIITAQTITNVTIKASLDKYSTYCTYKYSYIDIIPIVLF